MKNNTDNELIFEDISSSTAPSKKNKIISFLDNYASAAIKHIDNVIKAISFIVAIGILLFFVAISLVLLFIDKALILISIGILILGIVLALIFLFLIYGIGHIIEQNNDILSKL